jgi:hypothetical protein
VASVVTVAAVAAILTLAALVVVAIRGDGRDPWWWVAVGSAVVLGAVSITSAVRARVRRQHYLQGVHSLAARVAAGDGQSVDLMVAARQELKWAVDAGELEIAVELDGALDLRGRRTNGASARRRPPPAAAGSAPEPARAAGPDE